MLRKRIANKKQKKTNKYNIPTEMQSYYKIHPNLLKIYDFHHLMLKNVNLKHF